jgi:uncharacterized membrane-anchored protein YhcB (DUF1043 family)
LNKPVARVSDPKDHPNHEFFLIEKLESQLRDFKRELDELRREVQAHG